jgi:hypothetical protein
MCRQSSQSPALVDMRQRGYRNRIVMLHLPRLLPTATTSVLLAAAVLTSTGPGAARPAEAATDTPYSVPVPPPKCTQAQAASGNVAGCLLAFWGDPADDGWGVAPAPGVGDGWTWTGYTYSGSPALAAFEATNIGSNTAPVGELPTGYLETHLAARHLFEGFLSELQAGGYEVRHASGYSFRCTGAWSCPSGDTGDLSLHAWGLAIDMNSDANPIRTYTSQDGQSACLTPMVTDLPEWAIRAAERWGLYWGGYGWNSGCNVAGAERTAVSRDAPHFEFRGTPDQARAIAQFNLANDPNVRCVAAVADDGSATEQCSRSGRPEATWRLPVTTQPPAGATAALVNLTATDGAAPGYLTLETCGAVPAGPRATSTLTYAAAESVATMAIVPLDSDGGFCVYRASAVHSVVDVVGYLVNAASAGSGVRWLQPTQPSRLLDTRDAAAPLAAGTERPIPGADGDTLVNLAAVADAAPGYLQAGVCGALGPEAGFSHVNYAGHTSAGPSARANLTLVRAGHADPCVFSRADAHVVVDALATLDPVGGFGWQVATPHRALDTRTRAAGLPNAGELIEIDVATTAPAAAVALTVTGPTAAGYLSVGRCADLQAQLQANGRPTTSNLNHTSGQTVTNLATTAVDDGKICVYTKAAAHVIVDVQAGLTVEHAVGLVPITPVRVHDSR